MAKIELKNIGHNYNEKNVSDDTFTIRNLNLEFKDGVTYALLGPSGCGKTTLLNIISGLISPTEGKVIFDGEVVNHLPTSKRKIAQVFQFPVVYDTMTVYENLAFPLKNHNYPADEIEARVHKVAEMVGLTDQLNGKVAGLTADGKQKISLGRGLVREEIKVFMFDEPLTVIDPNLKWQIRTKLKEVHQQVKSTMIYVTHDQTEALSFADQVVVMYEGRVVQIGTPEELFDNSNHTFVGHFIGSPGMNLLDCELQDGKLFFLGLPVDTGKLILKTGQRYQIGIRPERIEFATSGIGVTIERVKHLGQIQILEVKYKNQFLKMVLPGDMDIPNNPKINFPHLNTLLFIDDWASLEKVNIRMK